MWGPTQVADMVSCGLAEVSGVKPHPNHYYPTGPIAVSTALLKKYASVLAAKIRSQA